MNENKQIEEMAKIIDGIEDNAYTNACRDEAEADSEKIAEALYNSGYCRRSGLVNEIFADIEEILSRTDWRSYWDEGHITRQIAELKKQKYTDG